MADIKTVDCVGCTCPQPVLMTRDALEEMNGDVLEVIVDNEASKSNVERFGRSQGCDVAVAAEGETFRLTLTRSAASRPRADAPAAEEYVCNIPGSGLIYVFPSDVMGQGDPELGRVLMRAFVKTIKEVSPQPAKLLFYNSGVNLTSKESDLIQPFRALEEKGVEISSCGTCLDFFGRKDKLLVGRVTNMYEIMESMVSAAKVVSPM